MSVFSPLQFIFDQVLFVQILFDQSLFDQFTSIQPTLHQVSLSQPASLQLAVSWLNQPWFEQVRLSLYHLDQWVNIQVAQQLNHLSLLSIGFLFGAGLLTSLTPCTLSMLPITMGYIGGYEAKNRWQGTVQSIWFALGLSTTLAGLGIGAALLGRIYGKVGTGLGLVVSVVAILMGLYLLEALPLRLPSLSLGQNWNLEHLPKGVRAFLLGLTFGLVASPCSTPVLATLLAWISSTQNPVLGGGLLLSYTSGYVLPIIVVGMFTASMKQFLSIRQWSGWINPASGVLLVGFGVFSLVTRLLPISV
ncbi:MAG: cytochrome c biogenesis protein CcdA [Thermosynechococcaceae cyanobacterium MS004]|nr:cytochrome c biogenesis protein CcdA [Thermosynechococcaceae cyanobacterium MS004]